MPKTGRSCKELLKNQRFFFGGVEPIKTTNRAQGLANRKGFSDGMFGE